MYFTYICRLKLFGTVFSVNYINDQIYGGFEFH